MGLETEDIIEVLNRLCKVPVPDSITQFIRQCTLSYGKVKLVLKHNRYFVESSHPETLQMLLKDPIISSGRIVRDENDQIISAPPGSALLVNSKPTNKDLNIPGISKIKDIDDGSVEKIKELTAEEAERKKEEEKYFGAVVGIDKEDEEDDFGAEQVHSFEIAAEHVEVSYHATFFFYRSPPYPSLCTQNIKKRCNDIDYPMLEEYDFRNDTINANLEIDLKPTTTIRPYQEKSLSKMFGNG